MKFLRPLSIYFCGVHPTMRRGSNSVHFHWPTQTPPWISLSPRFWMAPPVYSYNSYLMRRFSLRLFVWSKCTVTNPSRHFSTSQEHGASQSTKREQVFYNGGPIYELGALQHRQVHAVGNHGGLTQIPIYPAWAFSTLYNSKSMFKNHDMVAHRYINIKIKG